MLRMMVWSPAKHLISDARFRDLFGIEARCGLVQDKYIGIVNDRLRESDTLPVAFRKLVDQLIADVCDSATLG